MKLCQFLAPTQPGHSPTWPGHSPTWPGPTPAPPWPPSTGTPALPDDGNLAKQLPCVISLAVRYPDDTGQCPGNTSLDTWPLLTPDRPQGISPNQPRPPDIPLALAKRFVMAHLNLNRPSQGQKRMGQTDDGGERRGHQ